MKIDNKNSGTHITLTITQPGEPKIETHAAALTVYEALCDAFYSALDAVHAQHRELLPLFFHPQPDTPTDPMHDTVCLPQSEIPSITVERVLKQVEIDILVKRLLPHR